MRSRKQSLQKKQKKKAKRKLKKKPSRKWDNSRTDLGEYKLSSSKQLEKKLNAVSKHRHYAKDLIHEQRRKHFEQRKLKEEEKEIEQEQKQLIRRKQLLLRRQSIPPLKKMFPVFTAGRYSSDDSDNSEQTISVSSGDNRSDNDHDDNDDWSHHKYKDDQISTSAEKDMTLKALSNKLESLENELETMKFQKLNHSNNSNTKVINDADNQTTASIQENKLKSTKTLNLKFPAMPNISQPPQLTQSSNNKDINIINDDNKDKDKDKENIAVDSLNVTSLLLLMDKLKIYFQEIQTEKKQNEEFRSTLLESVNAQNTQILHLLSQLASHQKEIDQLKNKVSTLNVKLNKYESLIIKPNLEPKWININEDNKNNKNNQIELKDVKNIIEQSRAINSMKSQQIFQQTNWKSISNALQPKNNTFKCENSIQPQQPYTIQKHHVRSFLPKTIISNFVEDAPHVIAPQPVPKPKSVEQQNVNTDCVSNYQICNYPKVRVERFCK